MAKIRRTLGLLTKFSIYSFFIVLALGLTLNYYISLYVEEQIFANFAEVAVPIQNQLLSPQLDSQAFKSVGALDNPRFNRFMRERVFSKDIVFAKIWRRDGTVLWSNEKGTIGKKFRPKHELLEALDEGKVTYERTDLSDVENIVERPKYDELLEIYTPIKKGGKIVGAYEVYYALDPVLATIEKIRRFVSLALTGGLSFLYLAQFGIVKAASDTITKQNTELREVGDELSASLEALKANYLGTLISFDAALDARDKVTSAHSGRMSEIAHKIGARLGLDEEAYRRIDYAAQLHDIGKIGVPEHILRKPGRLTPEEFDEMKKHPSVGADIISSVPFLKATAEVVRHHHERYDGGGYPDGLSGDDIPIEARILTVVDSFDAMTNDRPYRKALSVDEAIAELIKYRGAQFDPTVVDMFLEDLSESAGRVA